MKWMSLALVGVTACGRIAFEPRGMDAEVGTSGLLLHFAFEADGVLRERAMGRDATCSGPCPTLTDGVQPASSAARFDGSSCLIVPAGDLAPPTLTFAAWARPDDLRIATMVGKPHEGGTTSTNTFELFTQGGTEVTVLAGDGLVVLTPAFGVWHHLAGVYEAGTLTAYVDGQASGAMTALPPLSYAADEVRIGCDLDEGAQRAEFFGALDDVRIYDRALTATEIAALAQ